MPARRRPAVRWRLLGSFLVAALVAVGLAVVATPAAAGPSGPQVAGLSQTAGRLEPHTLTLSGAGFTKVERVTFGRKAGTHVRVLSPRKIKVTTPRMRAGTTVPVRVVTASGASKPVRYRFIGAPKVSSLSKTRGPLSGGTAVTIRGRDLDRSPVVRFGDLAAPRVKVVSPTRLSVRTPPSYAQAAPVTVTTRHGRSKPSDRATFRFVEPAPVAEGEIEPQEGVAELAGTDVSAVVRNGDTGWTVTLTSPAPAVAAGTGLVLQPGSDVHPTGLAGRVTSVVVNGDGSRSVEVAAVPLSEVLAEARVEFSGPIGDLSEPERPQAGRPTWDPQADRSRAVPSKLGFGAIKAGAFECENKLGEPAELSGKIHLDFTHVRPHFYFDDGGLFSDPYLSMYVAYERELSVAVTASRQAECKLKASWQNSHKKYFIGPYGASLTFAPAVEFSVTASGTVEFTQHSYHMLGFTTNPDGSLRSLTGNSADPVAFGASGSFGMEAYVGLEIQVGWMDRIGVGISAGLAGTAELSVSGSTEDYPEVCGTLRLTLRGSLYAYLDVWVKKWTLKAIEADMELGKLEKCWSMAPEGDPEIITTSFPDRAERQWVSFDLTTEDHRWGTWAVEPASPGRPALPPGLSLDGYTISGIAEEAGTWTFVLVFTDEYDRVVRAPAEITIRTEVQFEAAVFALVNDLREEWGCAPLVPHQTLQVTAWDHSWEMAEYEYFDTYSLDGRDLGDRLEEYGYDWTSWGENIGYGYDDPTELVDGWVEDPGGHGTLWAMVDCDYEDGGVGLSFDQWGDPYWTLDMATEWGWRESPDRSDPPAPGSKPEVDAPQSRPRSDADEVAVTGAASR